MACVCAQKGDLGSMKKSNSYLRGSRCWVCELQCHRRPRAHSAHNDTAWTGFPYYSEGHERRLVEDAEHVRAIASGGRVERMGDGNS